MSTFQRIPSMKLTGQARPARYYTKAKTGEDDENHRTFTQTAVVGKPARRPVCRRLTGRTGRDRGNRSSTGAGRGRRGSPGTGSSSRTGSCTGSSPGTGGRSCSG